MRPCAAGTALVGAVSLSTGETALWLIVLCGLMNSIMWPVIFPLAITGLGPFTKQGSSYLIMAIVGGALIPPLMGWLATHGGGLRVAFVVAGAALRVPAACRAEAAAASVKSRTPRPHHHSGSFLLMKKSPFAPVLFVLALPPLGTV
ncbi:MAG: hypothetical protein WKG07_29110 [Hymenobacter sp.]